MRIAATAKRFGPNHAVAVVVLDGDIFFSCRLPEARPAGTGFELVFGAEQLGPAAHAAVDAFLMIVPVRAGERALGAFLARNVKLLRSQILLPLSFALF